MRLFPLLTAAVVVAVLYLLVFERDRLLGMAGVEQVPTETVEVSETVAEAAAHDAGAVPVVAQRSAAQEIDSAVVLRGRTEAAREVDVPSETTGLVVSEPLRKGARVAEGELLCRLDIGTRESALAEAESRLAEAQARLADAEINLTAAARLSSEGFASETRRTAAEAAAESARAGVRSAEAGVASARTEIGRIEIRAPFDGLLETDSAELGTLLQPGSVCATIIQLDPIKLVGFVPEVDVDRVTVGAAAGARLASGREVLGEVTFLSRSADPTTRTFRVEVEVPNADQSIRDGQTAEIFVSSAGATAHLLPQSALTLDDEGRLGVRLVVDAAAAFAPVSVVRDVPEGIWVTGLAPEVDVIVVGQDYVTDGVPVAVTMREAAE
jgi:multidrug efflux system membrane fusion protein